MQILAFGILLILIIGASAISISKIWHKGQEIFDDWDGVKDSLTSLEVKVSALYDTISGDEDEILSESSSPVRLTKRGRKVAEKIHAEELVGKYLNEFDATGLDNAYDIHPLFTLIVLLGSWAEVILPLLIFLGLFTRGAALAMMGFVMVQSLVDVYGHNVEAGGWFDRASDGVVMDQRLFWLFILAILVSKGAGPVSLDRILGIER